MIVSRSDLDASLARVRSMVDDPKAGLFGPESSVWTINKESVLFLGGGRAALLQIAHPFVATAVDEHSQTRTDPQGRFARTFANVFAMVFGDLDHAEKAARRVHAIHSRITGELPENIGAFPRGTAYHANDADSLMWVHATLVEGAVSSYERIVRPLRGDEKQRYYVAMKRFAYLFGIPDSVLPPSWPAFCEYWDDMIASDRLAVGTAAANIGRFLFLPPRRSMAPVLAWYKRMTAGLMPERFREPFGLEFNRADRVTFAGSITALRTAHRVTPRQLHYLPAYVDARRRLAGKRGRYPIGRWADRIMQLGLSGNRNAA